MTATIRRATVSDLPWLRAFFCELQAEQQATHPIDYPQVGPDDADAFTLSMFRALGRPSVLLAVAVDGAEPVGFLGGEVLEREIGTPRRFGHAHYLYVRPAHRKQGVAAALMAYAAAWGTAQGVEVTECYGLAGDDSWARRGFKPLLTRYYQSLAAIAAASLTTGTDTARAADATSPEPMVSEPIVSKGARRRTKKRRINGVDPEARASHAARQ